MKRTVAIAIVAAACLACTKQSEVLKADAATTTAPAAAVQTKKLNLPPDHPQVGQMDAGTAPAAATGAAANLTGEVLETMNAGGYTYVKLKTGSGETWAALPEMPVKVGEKLALNGQMTLQNFESKTLKRTFPSIVFATPAGSGAAAPASAGMKAGDPMAQHATFAQGPATESDVKVAKAEGADAKTVEEVWSGKAALKDKNVTVRGKVVKFTPETLGVNWIHLRDGSGSADKKTNDLTVTTKEKVAIGDVITASGTVRTDKDFGAGYTYPVIVEGAKLKK